MKLEILHVADCPNVAVLQDRLAAVTSGRPDVEMFLRLVEDPEVAAQLGMRGSPTLLVDGADPFADPAEPTGASPAGSTAARTGRSAVRRRWKRCVRCWQRGPGMRRRLCVGSLGMMPSAAEAVTRRSSRRRWP